MENTIKLFVFVFVFLFAFASCSKEPMLIPETNVERTISSRTSTSFEMEVVNATYHANTAQLVVDLEANSDFSEVILEETQTLELQDDSSISLSVVSFSGDDGSLQIVFSASQTPSSGLVSMQDIIIEEGMIQ